MRPGGRRALAALFAALVLAAAPLAGADPALQRWSDAPDPTVARPLAVDTPPSYAEALARWRSAEAVNDWLGAHFRYDRSRALALSETARAARATPAIHAPTAFFEQPEGICVDMTHFAVSVLREVEPAAQPAYLMIEFEPVAVAGQVLRRHWMATFQRDGAHYFMADSKRPGHLAGPYASVPAFLADYAAYRGRAIVSHRVAASHERQQRAQARRAAAP